MFHNTGAQNSYLLQRNREYVSDDRWLRRRMHVPGRLVDRLELESSLVGHEGCVNCLEWSSDGRLLASGSDDFNVIIWDVFRQLVVHRLPTNHLGNMFSVKFMPGNDALMATGAADKYVYVFDINAHTVPLLQCNCHSSRVKRLATAPDSPFVFWTAGEDGIVLQLDTREQHVCRTSSNRVGLLNLCEYLGPAAEVKCVAVNPRRTEMLAVGANDPYARIYDRRMLKPVAVGESVSSDTPSPKVPKECVRYFCPGHINKKVSRLFEHESKAITYLTFNSSGTELLVNMGGEHVYLYDLQTASVPKFLDLPAYVPPDDVEVVAAGPTTTAGAAVASGSDVGAGSPPLLNLPKLPKHIEALKKRGNEYLETEKYLHAIEEYSKAITMAPDCAVLYLNRATAYMRRVWFGDVYAALRDCQQALRLNPSYIKAHFRLARALLELGLHAEADACVKELVARFPTYLNNHGVVLLQKDIDESAHSSSIISASSGGSCGSGSGDEASSSGGGSPGSPEINCPELNGSEFVWRSAAKDYASRYIGHCNTTTDIKEANYFGSNDEFIVAGSDDRNFYIWERQSGNIRAVYHADEAIVNCVQPHPNICMLATSGIDHDVKIWTPTAASPTKRKNLVSYFYTGVEDNQAKMKSDPFDLNTRNAFCWNG